MRDELERRFDQTVRAELAAPGTREPRFPLRLPPSLRETLVAIGPHEGAAAWYCERMPRLLVDQTLRGEDPARRLLWRPLRGEGRLFEALQGLERTLAEEQLQFSTLTGAASPEQLLESRPTAAALAAPTLLGSGLPLLGAWPAERDLIGAELPLRDADEVLDLRLSGGLLHELCHGQQRELSEPPPPWMVLEAAALYLGSVAFPRHVFPDVPGEAVPGVSLFVLLGQCLARLFGRRQLLRVVVEAAPLREAFGERARAALEAAARRDWEARREVPFARDALRALDWVRIADETREVPWADEPVTPADLDIAQSAVRALFQVNVMAPTFQTHPCEVQRLVLDVHRCVLSRPPRPDGVFGEPAFWIFPPPMCRRLRERGASAVAVEGARRRDALPIAEALIELSLGTAALPETAVVRWMSSS
jgi:hypothetical protein